MEIFGLCLIGLGLLVLVIGTMWFVFAAFMENVLWGLGILFIPPLWLLFLALHTDKAIKPFLTVIFAFALLLIGDVISDLGVP